MAGALHGFPPADASTARGLFAFAVIAVTRCQLAPFQCSAKAVSASPHSAKTLPTAQPSVVESMLGEDSAGTTLLVSPTAQASEEDTTLTALRPNLTSVTAAGRAWRPRGW